MTHVTSLRRLGAMVALLGLSCFTFLGIGCSSTDIPDESDSEHVGAAEQPLVGLLCTLLAVNGKVQICHHAGSGSHPYTILQASKDACILEHVGHLHDYIAVGNPSCSGDGCLPANASCDGTLPCCGNSSCTNGVCGCDAGWGGERCETQCPPGFTGADCDSPSLPCEPNPCQNGGVCTPGAPPSSTYTCSCAHGYTGVNCEIDAFAVKHCDSNPCVGEGSTCVDDAQGYTCLCAAPCPTSTNECEPGGCDSRTGVCVIPAAVPDGAACTDDGDPCTVDTCQGGACAHVVGPDVCGGTSCNGTPLVCDQHMGDCATGSCFVAQDAVPGAFGAQTFTLGGAVLQIAPETAVQVGGATSAAPVTITLQATSDPSLLPSSLPTADPVLFPIYQFGPSGTRFSPGLLFTIPVPLTATTPSAWLCDDSGLNCERRNGFLTLDSSVSPPRQTLTVAIDHFSTLVVTQSPTAVAQASCVTVQRGFSGNVVDATARYLTPHDPPTQLVAGIAAQSNLYGPGGTGGTSRYLPHVQWDLSSIPTYANVTSAFIQLFVENNLSPYEASTFYAAAGPWDEATITFGNRPELYRQPSATLQYGKGFARADVTLMTQLWTIGDTPNYGVALYADILDTSATYMNYGATSFWSSEAPTVSVRPRLDVCYTVACPGPGCVVQAGPGPVTQVSAGNDFTCVVKNDASLSCWGDNTFGQLGAPAGTFTQISSGGWHSCAIGTSGQVSCWGDNSYGQASPPSGTFSYVASGELYTCGVRTNGDLACWGLQNDGLQYDYGQASPPPGTFTQVSVGVYRACGLRADQTPVCWGNSPTTFSQTYTQVATSSGQTTCTLFAGQLTCTGNNDADAATPPTLDSFGQLSLGYLYGCALRTTGTLHCWGDNSHGQATPPPTTFVQAATGRQHACGVTSMGTVSCWGLGSSGETAVPAAFSGLTPTCTDGAKNGTETGNDCGGGTCPQCVVGGGCSTNSDCVTGNCAGGVCNANPCTAAPCQNGGTCASSGSSYTCACPSGYTGTNCQIPPADLCSGVVCAPSDACHDAGTCNPMTGVCSNPSSTACATGMFSDGGGPGDHRTDGPYTIGTQFQVGSSAVTIGALGAQDDSLSGPAADGFVGGGVQVGLWDATGTTLLASTTVLSADPLVGTYRYRALASPITLQPNTSYLIGALVSGAFEPFEDNIGAAKFSAHGVTIVGNRFASGGSLTAPTIDGTGTLGRWAPASALFGCSGAGCQAGMFSDGGAPGDHRADGPYTIGTQFQVGSSAVTIGALGAQDDSLSGPAADGFVGGGVQVGLWDATGTTLLASTTVLSADPLVGTYRYRALASPITLQPNTSYLIGALVGGAYEPFEDNIGAAKFSAHGVTIVGNRFAVGNSLTAPTIDGTGTLGRWAPASALFGCFGAGCQTALFSDSGAPASHRTDGPYTQGVLFQVGSSAMTVSALGGQDGSLSGPATDGFVGGGLQVGLWDATGTTLLASTTVLSTDPLVETYRYHTLASPVTLQANTSYLIGALVGGGVFEPFEDNAGAAKFSAHGATIVGNRFAIGDSLTAPTLDGLETLGRWAPASLLFSSP
ncbi:DNRLRE domain-containing protein [Sorangium sp. So ce302]|uniref:DNRLRE domain-containing protein n=1 Tax=Sorangium sp. So ce302 TaxID=3133297 RepID=UPI003F62B2E3